MFLRIDSRRDALKYIFCKLGFEDLFTDQTINVSDVFPMGSLTPSLTAYYLLTGKGFDDRTANKIIMASIHDRSRSMMIYFNVKHKMVIYKNVMMTIKKPRQLWKFRQKIFKSGDKPEILMFIEGTTKAYITNKKEGIERAWKLLTDDLRCHK